MFTDAIVALEFFNSLNLVASHNLFKCLKNNFRLCSVVEDKVETMIVFIFTTSFSLFLRLLIVTFCTNSVDAFLNQNPLQITKCCNEDEAYDIRKQECFRKTSDDYDYLLDLFYYSMIHTDNHHDANLLSPNIYNISSTGSPVCNYDKEEHLEVIINTEEPGNEQFIIAYPSNDLFETHQYKYHKNYCVDVAYGNGQYWGIAAMFCNRNLHLICQRKTCVRFCCAPGEIYDEQIGNCRPSLDPEIFRNIPQIYREDTRVKLYTMDNKTEFIYSAPECFKVEGYTSHVLQQNRILYNSNGHLNVGNSYFNHENACVYQAEQLEKGSHIITYITGANVCIPNQD